jgi:hypothetical protein
MLVVVWRAYACTRALGRALHRACRPRWTGVAAEEYAGTTHSALCAHTVSTSPSQHFSALRITCASDMCTYGRSRHCPNTSQSVTPNDHTSDETVKRFCDWVMSAVELNNLHAQSLRTPSTVRVTHTRPTVQPHSRRQTAPVPSPSRRSLHSTVRQ